MIKGRYLHAICNFKDVIYVFGGQGKPGRNFGGSSEKFDFGPTWESIEPLPHPVDGASCITHNNQIYIAGNCSTNIDIYNPMTNSYALIADAFGHPTGWSVSFTVSG